MENPESLEDFYKRRFKWLPEDLKNELGHFNIFNLEPYSSGTQKSIPYRRRDFFKLMLVKGQSKVNYADRIYEVKKQALSFSNPMVPYKWDADHEQLEGVYCIFNPRFFSGFGEIEKYEIFQPSGTHVFELTDTEVVQVTDIFLKMQTELQSDYKYRFDLIRNLIFELVHFGLKLRPADLQSQKPRNASLRIASIFLELLERQFPIDDSHQNLQLRTPADFAGQLNIHVNHLNRAVKEMTKKTTSRLIGERLLRESQTLLRQSAWNVSEIAYSLGFTEVPHFNNFFKKETGQTPTQYRKNRG